MHPFKHFKTITKHRHKVIGHCRRAGIFWQGLRHDLSKYAPVEFFRGAKYYQGMQSPNVQERAENGYSAAWLHHKGRNRHHFEYWTDYHPTARKIVPVKMPLRYVIEMFCDRVAASKIYRGDAYKDSDPLDYFEHGKTMRMIHPQTSDFLERLLTMLAEKGEDETFAFIRSYVRENDTY